MVQTLPSTARDGGLHGAGGLRIGSLSKGERWGRNEPPQVIWESLEQVRRAISSSWGLEGAAEVGPITGRGHRRSSTT